MKQQNIKRLFLLQYTRIFVLMFFSLTIFHCTERNRSNPFDPANNQTLPVALTLRPEGGLVKLNWKLEMTLSDFRGFRIYRAVDSLANIQPLIDLSADQFHFTDTSSSYGHWYYYQISLLGNSEESRLSKYRKTYSGPGRYWTLSPWEASIKEVSYDLNYILKSYPIAYDPTEWSIVRGNSSIWLNYNTIYKKAISRFNKTTGKEVTISRFPELKSPLDLVFDAAVQKLYVLDTTRMEILTFKDKYLVATTSLDSTKHYISLEIDSFKNNLLLLSEKHFLVQSVTTGIVSVLLSFPEGYKGMDVRCINQKIYILSVSEKGPSSQLYIVSSDLSIQDSLKFSGFFYQMNIDYVNDEIYLAEQRRLKNDMVVKFSNTGSPLFQLTGFMMIEQMTINPYDQSLLIIDYPAGSVSLFDNQGKLINKMRSSIRNRHLYWPIRIFVE